MSSLKRETVSKTKLTVDILTGNASRYRFKMFIAISTLLVIAYYTLTSNYLKDGFENNEDISGNLDNGDISGNLDNETSDNNNDEIKISPSDGLFNIYNRINNKNINKLNPIMIIIFLGILLTFYIIFRSLGTNYNELEYGNSSGLKFMEILMWGLFVFLILINGLQYFFNWDMSTSLKNIFSNNPELDITVGGKNWLDGKNIPNLNIKKPKLPDNWASFSEDEKMAWFKNNVSDKSQISHLLSNNEYVDSNEVFHIGNNKYTYKQAEAICKAYGGDLANYKQIEDAYKKGGEWCGYGWSKNQLALFPTQITTWKRLLNIKGHEQSCGRPGINGGYIDNINAKFGINCFGKKPSMNKDDRDYLISATPYPKTKEEGNMDKLVNYYKSRLNELQVMPFNYNKWNKV
tara:strand:- start:2069 stop:3283 length:1215 start_codon:yes stop_codon:yes gene_type:complete